MRMRKKPNLIPRMERCAAVQIFDPTELYGRWKTAFPDFQNIYLELGCGKGRFTAETAASMPENLLVALEKVPDAMVVGMERVCAAGLNNVRFISGDAAQILTFFAPGEISRIYINFCDPWPTKRHAKRRLTAPGFLALYAALLPPGGEIHFKTDNRPLFDYSLETFQEAGFVLSQVSNDLHAQGIQGVMTDYEEKFHNQGIPINRCVATWEGEKK